MQIKRKPVLITNASKHNLFQVEALIQRAKLFGEYLVVPAEDFSDDILRLTNRYNLTVVVPVASTDEDPESIVAIEARNPGFTDRLRNHPANKLVLMHITRDQSTAAHVLSLALEFPKHRLVVTTLSEAVVGFHDTKHELWNIVQQVEEYKEVTVEFINSLGNVFDVLDYQFCSNIGLVGGTECSTMLK